MKKLESILKLLSIILLVVLATSCKKDKKMDEEPIAFDITQNYIAGKFQYQQGPEIPFAFIPSSSTKGTFIYADDKIETAFIFQNNKFSTKIYGADFSFNIKNGKIEDITVISDVIGISSAAINKKQDPALAFAGKRFEGVLKKLDGSVAYNNYYFQFNSDPAQLKYNSNPVLGKWLLVVKSYVLLADGCVYNNETKSFGILSNNKLEFETKLANDFVLFSGTLK